MHMKDCIYTSHNTASRSTNHRSHTTTKHKFYTVLINDFLLNY